MVSSLFAARTPSGAPRAECTRRLWRTLPNARPPSALGRAAQPTAPACRSVAPVSPTSTDQAAPGRPSPGIAGHRRASPGTEHVVALAGIGVGHLLRGGLHDNELGILVTVGQATGAGANVWGPDHVAGPSPALFRARPLASRDQLHGLVPAGDALGAG